MLAAILAISMARWQCGREYRRMATTPREEQKSTFRLPKNIHRALKIHAAQTDRKMSDLVSEAVQDYLKTQKRRSA